MADRLAVSVPEAAAAIGIGKTLAWELALRGELPTFQIGRRRLVAVEALEDWVAGQALSTKEGRPTGGRRRRTHRVGFQPTKAAVENGSIGMTAIIDPNASP